MAGSGARRAAGPTARGGAVALLAIVLVGLAAPSASADDPPEEPPPAPVLSGTLVVGDSLTVRAQDKLEALRPDWVIDGKRGRKVTRLPDVVAAHVEESGPPERLVIALGTNWVASWEKADYAAVLDSLPAETKVLFVTTYRDPKVWGRDVADRLRTYNRWMRQLAGDRDGTGYAGWAWKVSRRPSLLLADGVHQTRKRGERAWARMVVRKLERL